MQNEKMTEELRIALKKAASDALSVQNAVNISGVVHAWDIEVSVLWRVNNAAVPLTGGTDWVNQHPVNVMFAAKCASLTNLYWDVAPSGEDVFDAATKYCEAMVADPTSTPVDYHYFGKEEGQ